MTLAMPTTQFDRRPGSDAIEPPEAHGVARDAVKLLVARPGGVSHARFADLGAYLRPGDLLVVNNSATMPAAVDGRRAGRPSIFSRSSVPRKTESSLAARQVRDCVRATTELPTRVTIL